MYLALYGRRVVIWSSITRITPVPYSVQWKESKSYAHAEQSVGRGRNARSGQRPIGPRLAAGLAVPPAVTADLIQEGASRTLRTDRAAVVPQ